MRIKQLGAGLTVHVLLACLILFVPAPRGPSEQARIVDSTARATVWYGGGAPSGGDRQRAQLSTRTQRTVAPASFKIPSTPKLEAMLELPGVVAALSAADAVSAGVDDGKGKGRGPGDGPGEGPGPGTGGPGPGGGDGPFQAGAPGITTPAVVHEQRPEYTAEAMRAKIQGTVIVEALVQPDGSVGAVRIVQSVDDRFGLDQNAAEAVRRWRFRPGTRHGKAVPVLVLIELTFTLR